MSKRILGHLRSNVIGCLALFLALSMGTAYATHKGGANTISSGDIIDGEVKNLDIGANAVTGDKVLNRSISFGDLAADSIFSGHIATGNVQSIDVRNNDLSGLDIADTSSLGGAEINEDALTAGGVLSGSLANAQLAASSVDAQSLAPDSVDGQKIKDDSVNTAELAPSSVDGQKIADDAVDTAEIAPNAVESTEIAADAVDTSDIQSGAVESSEIADDAVKAEEIENSAVGSAEIAPNAVGTSEIGTLPAAIACCLQNRSVPSDTPVVLGFNSHLMNNGGMFDPTQPTRLTVPVAGLYQVSGSLYWEPDPSPSGFREVGFRCTCVFAGLQQEIIAHERELAHGADTGGGLTQPGAQVMSASALVALKPSDYIEMLVYQNSGREQTISATTAQNGPRFSLAWVAPTS